MAGAGLKIVAGGQTGVDRGALDAALALGEPCGGWCPHGRLDENGQIPAHYPLAELPKGGFLERTIRNVRDSDGTLVIYFHEPQGGTLETVNASIRAGKPHLLIDAMRFTVEEGSARAEQFVRTHSMRTLNIAGPRASEAPKGYAYAHDFIRAVLQRLRAAKYG